MEIAIIGWYGTETIGDRAILAGIFNSLANVYSTFSIRIGSLYPFYTQRTILEDLSFYKQVSNNHLEEIQIFYSLNPCELKSAISKSHMLMVGGGPLMDLREMNMLEYAFLYAASKRKRKILYGCGWGPLRSEYCIKKACRLVQLADLTIFRDAISLNECGRFMDFDKSKVISSIDPACFSCDYFVTNAPSRNGDYISVNFRDVAEEGKQYSERKISDESFVSIVKELMSHYDLPIHLVPMHNFFIGGDDRAFLSRIAKEIGSSQLQVIQQPLSLSETMEDYYHAFICVGMRFHSVLLQTILNGRNYIVDYTDPQKGKIRGLIEEFGLNEAYRSRYQSLYSRESAAFDLEQCEQFHYSSEFIAERKSLYVDKLIELSV